MIFAYMVNIFLRILKNQQNYLFRNISVDESCDEHGFDLFSDGNGVFDDVPSCTFLKTRNYARGRVAKLAPTW
jgi:hypothetical protein